MFHILVIIRLPQTVFKDNAGTEVVTDVIFYKAWQGEPAGEAWQVVRNHHALAQHQSMSILPPP